MVCDIRASLEANPGPILNTHMWILEDFRAQILKKDFTVK